MPEHTLEHLTVEYAVRVESVAGRTYTTLLTAEHHGLLADEPAERDGDGLGPTPMQLALLALGSCASITIQMYARRKGWDVRAVAIDVALQAVEDEGRRRDRIERRIVLEGDLDPEQRRRLIEVAGRCPVTKLVRNEPEVVDIDLTDGAG